MRLRIFSLYDIRKVLQTFKTDLNLEKLMRISRNDTSFLIAVITYVLHSSIDLNISLLTHVLKNVHSEWRSNMR